MKRLFNTFMVHGGVIRNRFKYCILLVIFASFVGHWAPQKKNPWVNLWVLYILSVCRPQLNPKLYTHEKIKPSAPLCKNLNSQNYQQHVIWVSNSLCSLMTTLAEQPSPCMTIPKPHSVIRFDSCGQALSQRLFLDSIQYQHCMAWFVQPNPITIIFLVTPGWICGIHYYSLLSQLPMAFTIIPYTTHCKCAHSNQKFDKTNSGRLRGIPGCHGTPFQLSVLLYNYITSYFYLFFTYFCNSCILHL